MFPLATQAPRTILPALTLGVGEELHDAIAEHVVGAVLASAHTPGGLCRCRCSGRCSSDARESSPLRRAEPDPATRCDCRSGDDGVGRRVRCPPYAVCG